MLSPKQIAFLVTSALALFMLACQQPTEPISQEPPPSHIMLFEDFDLQQPGETWSFLEPDHWRVAVEDQRRFLQMAYPRQDEKSAATLQPDHYALYNAYRFRSFSLSCRLRLDQDVANETRNACVIFGYQDQEHYYYINLSNQKGRFRNTIVCVTGDLAKPLPLDQPASPPQINDNTWHKIDVLRNANTGAIEVYLDAYKKDAHPLLKAADSTYQWGYIGLGAIHDHASFAHLALQGEGRKALPPNDLRKASASQNTKAKK